MDVLVRLATEAPDIGGLPAELTGLVTACLDRAPRHRPTSAALLAALAPFVRTPPEADSGHAYLTSPEIALIEEYQRSPQPQPRAGDAAVPGDDESSDDATFGSHTALAQSRPGGDPPDPPPFHPVAPNPAERPGRGFAPGQPAGPTPAGRAGPGR